MGDEQLGAGVVDGRQRRLQAALAVLAGLLEHRIDATVEASRLIHHLVGDRFVHADVPPDGPVTVSAGSA
jgi:hypothetical protein